MMRWIVLLFLIKGLAGRVTFQNAQGGVLVISTREGSPINTTLVTLKAITDEPGKTVYYSLQSRSFLDVEPLSGRVYNTVVLDAETVDYINVIAEAYTDPVKKTTLQVFVEIGDINDNKPLFSEQSYVVNIKEDIVVGEFVTKVTAKDADDSGYVISYSFEKEHPKFRINKVSGSITTKETLDHEDVKQYNLTVIASDSELSSNASLTINVLDADDLGPVFNQSVYNVSLTEGTYENETFLVQVHAYDGDLTVKQPVVYSLEKETLDTAVLRIDGNTGELFIKGTIDREVEHYREIIVRASSTNHALVSAVVQLSVEDVNEYNPYFPYTLYNGSVLENAAPGTLVMTMKAIDEDKNVLRYWIVNGNQSNYVPFRITDSGEILVNGSIDRELTDSYTFKVMVEEANTTESYQNETWVQIQVTDTNDNPPVFTNASVTLSLVENTPPPVFLHQFHATDRDIGTNAIIVYSIGTSSNQQGADGFAINATGHLQTTKAFDRETKDKFTFNVLAKNPNNENRFGSISVTVEILNTNDNSPFFESDFYVAEVIETVRPGAVVTRVQAQDRDAGDTELSYSFVNGSNGDFIININSGVITTAKALNRELQSDYNITIQVSDEGSKTDVCMLHVQIVDVNDNGPVFENATGYHFSVPEGEDNTVVGQVMATDTDSGLAGDVRYELDNQYFQINETSGEIKTTQSLDREARGEHVFVVKAKDLAIDFRISTVQVTVTVLDVNDNSPIFVGDKVYSSVVQTSVALHTTLFTFKATDEDIGENGKIWYTSSQVPDFLSLNKSTGDLKVSARIPAAVEATLIEVNATNVKSPFQRDTALLKIIFVSHKIDAPTFSKSVFQESVDENAPSNTVVIDLDATYENQPENTNFTYAITHGDLNAFSIHQELGIIATLKPLDRETTDEYTLIVSVSLKGRESSNFATVNIEVKDTNDNPPLFNTNVPLKIEQKENLELIPSPWKCHDNDIGDNALITYRVNGSDLVLINEDTGELALKRPLDYETDPHVINITVTCINHIGEAQLHSSVDLKLVIIDTNDNAPTFSQSEYTVEINEYEVSSSLFTVNATDKDEGMNGKISYKMKSITPTSKCLHLDSSTGNLFVSCSLDRENISRYVIDVEARDSGTPPLSSTVRVNVIVADVNDQLPVFSKEEFSFSFPENRQASEIGRLEVTDGDEGQPCQYCIIYEGDDDASFYISAGGMLHSTKPLDRETKESYRLAIRAYLYHPTISAANTFSNCTVIIQVTDENDNPPIFRKKEIITGVLNTSPYGIIVTTLNAIDKDRISENVFDVISGNSDYNFYLKSDTGILTTVRDISSKTSTVFTLAVRVTNKETVVSSTVKQDTASVRVIVFDQTSLVKFSVSQNASIVRESKVELERFLSNTTQYQVTIHQIESKTEASRPIVSCYGINVGEMKMVSKDILTSSLRNHSLLNSFWNITPIGDDPDGNSGDEDTERQLLIGIILGVSVLVVGLIMLAIFLWLRGEQRKRKRPNKAVTDEMGVAYKDNGGFVPNGTRYYVEPYESSDMYGTIRSNSADAHLPKTFLQDPNNNNNNNGNPMFTNPSFVEEEIEEEAEFSGMKKPKRINTESGTGSKPHSNKVDSGQGSSHSAGTSQNTGNLQNGSKDTEENPTNANANQMITTL